MILFGNLAYATSFSVDKSTYQSGDEILLTGSVSPIEEGAFISVQILNPPSSDFAQIDTFLPNSDGSFSRTYKADGPKWTIDGTYTMAPSAPVSRQRPITVLQASNTMNTESQNTELQRAIFSRDLT